MGTGIAAIKAEIQNSFSGAEIDEIEDRELAAIHLRFIAEGRSFHVRVSEEFDRDYGQDKTALDLDLLGAQLRASSNGRIVIRRSGVQIDLSSYGL